MKKVILLPATIVLLVGVILVGCESAPDDTEQLRDDTETPRIETDQEEQEQNEEVDISDMPEPLDSGEPHIPTDEEIKRFEENIDLLNLPFEIPSRMADGEFYGMININEPGPMGWDPYIEFHRFLMDLLEGHWHLTYPHESISDTAFRWDEFMFTTNSTSEPLSYEGPAAGARIWYEMIEFNVEEGEQPGRFALIYKLELEYNRIVIITYIFLDDHAVLAMNGSHRGQITWHFYFDNLNVAFWHTREFSIENPDDPRLPIELPMGYTRRG